VTAVTARAAAALALALMLTLAGPNFEGDALSALRRNLRDLGGVLQSREPTQVDPCSWFHVTSDSGNRVTHLLTLHLGAGPLPRAAKQLRRLMPFMWLPCTMQHRTVEGLFNSILFGQIN
jgi:hypothetical protein